MKVKTIAAVCSILLFVTVCGIGKPVNARHPSAAIGARAANGPSRVGRVGPNIGGQRSSNHPASGVPPNPAIARPSIIASYGKLPLSFEANQGQAPKTVKFLSHGSGYTLFLTNGGAILSLQQPKGTRQHGKAGGRMTGRFPKRAISLRRAERRLKAQDLTASRPAVLKITLVGANPKAAVSGAKMLPGRTNYFIGNDPKKWRTNIPTYAKVQYDGVYPGVNLVYYGNQRQLEYDFVVAPGADPRVIKFDVGAELAPPAVAASDRQSAVGTPPLQAHAQQAATPRIEKNGDLVIQTGAGEVRFRKPLVYQPVVALGVHPDAAGERRASLGGETPLLQRKVLDGHYVIFPHNAGQQTYEIGFDVSGYDRSKPLIIDPVLAYSSYLGGSNSDQAGIWHRR